MNKNNNLPSYPVISRIFPFSPRPGEVKETAYRNDPSSTRWGVIRQRMRVARTGGAFLGGGVFGRVADRPFSFYGVGYSSRGEKGRFVLPPTFRKLVKEASAGSRILCLNKHERWPCLTGFGTTRGDFIPEQVDKEEAAALARGAEFDRDLRFGQLSGFVDVPFDESGRFVFPDYLAAQAGLGDDAFFNGNGPFFTIWNPAALAKMGAGWEPMQAACAALASEAKGKRA